MRELRALEPRPPELLLVAISDVNSGRVPAALQEELISRANTYAHAPTDGHRRALDELLAR